MIKHCSRKFRLVGGNFGRVLWKGVIVLHTFLPNVAPARGGRKLKFNILITSPGRILYHLSVEL